MKNNKKGFTLVELLSVLILLVVIITIATINFVPTFDKGKKKALVDEAMVFSQGALNKYADDRMNKTYSSDMFSNKNSGKKCYSIRSLIGRYVSKDSKKYKGSIEICTSDTCLYKTKLWLTDGEFYINGSIVDESLSIDDIDIVKNGEYFDTCGVDTSNIENQWLFDYKGFEETFVVPADGTYALESWGAQGGDAFYMVRDSFGFGSHPVYLSGGRGSYAYVEVDLQKGDTLFINVGGAGPYFTYDRKTILDGGYNGGGKANYHSGGGGGATSIALKSGLLPSLKIADVLEVAGGGGGGHGNGGEYFWGREGASGGGNCDNSGAVCLGSGVYGKADGLGAGGGIYTSGGGPLDYPMYVYSWGGVTYYYTNSDLSPAFRGGSGYVGNPLTKNGVMYSVGGVVNNNDYQRTYSTPYHSSEPVPHAGKMGNGFVRITNITNVHKDLATEDFVYYSNGTQNGTLGTSNTWADNWGLSDYPRFDSDHISLYGTEYMTIYTSAIDLSKYNTVIIKKTNGVDSSYVRFKEFPDRTEWYGDIDVYAGKLYSPIWVPLSGKDNVYMADVSGISYDSLHFIVECIRGSGTGDVYYIAFTPKTITQIKDNPSFIP